MSKATAAPPPPQPNQGALVAGGIILGIWLMLAFILATGDMLWWLRAGLFGIVTAAALYGIRFTSAEVRTVLTIVISLAIGAGLVLFVGFAFSSFDFEAILMLLSYVLALWGAVLITQGLPKAAPSAND